MAKNIYSNRNLSTNRSNNSRMLAAITYRHNKANRFSKPPRTAREASEREQFREIYQKLNEAGIATRTVFWSRKEKENWYEIKDLEKELEEAVEAHHGDNEDGRTIWETIKKCRDSNTTKQWHC